MRNLVIRTENLTKEYGPQRGIDGLTLDVEPGEVFGFLGPEGSGKTTTIRLLLDFIKPTRGSASVLCLDSRRDAQAIRKRVGYSPAHFHLYEDRTAGQMLRLLAGLQGNVVWSEVDRLAERFHLDLDASIALLSDCDRQKIGLVQALMHRPQLVILDEPTNRLDDITREALYQMIAEIRAQGQAVFWACDQPGEVERLCDRVGVVRDGRLVAVERVVQFKTRSLRKVEIRFAGPVPAEPFQHISNVKNLRMDHATLRCTIQGEADALVKAAGQFRVMDMISRESTLDEVFKTYEYPFLLGMAEAK